MEKHLILLDSLIELGHATSQNLLYSHKPNVHISYGEETITETNLLELHRRNPDIVKLNTFSKKHEARNGSDWEWHIIGRHRTFRMRVQAKRLQKNGKLKIPHTVSSSGAQQIDLLIKEAEINNFLPVYCIYSSNDQRSDWKQNGNNMETGCLLIDAHKVKQEMPDKLSDIEASCIPWHYLVTRKNFSKIIYWPFNEPDKYENLYFASREIFKIEEISKEIDTILSHEIHNIFPTLKELNSDEKLDREIIGIVESGVDEYKDSPPGKYYEEGSSDKQIFMDVSKYPSIGAD